MGSSGRTAVTIFALGFGVSLCGDATHVASGTTRYLHDAPDIWNSAIWFPFAVAASVLALADLGRRLALPPVHVRTRRDVPGGAAAVLALYALTSALRGEPETVSVALVSALAVVIWAMWDPSAGAALGGALAAVLGPTAEILLVEWDVAEYASDSDGLFGVALWLPALYFAAGAVAFRLWDAVRSGPGMVHSSP